MFLLFPVAWDFTWHPWFVKYDAECIGNHTKDAHVQPDGLICVQSHQVSNLFFAYREVQGYEICGTPDCQWRIRQITCWAFQPSPRLLLDFFLINYWRRCTLPGLPLLTSAPIEPVLVTFHISCKVQFICSLVFLNPSPHLQTESLHYSQATHSHFHCLFSSSHPSV